MMLGQGRKRFRVTMQFGRILLLLLLMEIHKYKMDKERRASRMKEVIEEALRGLLKNVRRALLMMSQ